MQKRFTVCILTMLSITCGAAVAAQLTPAQKIDRVTSLLLSLETRDPRPLTYIDSDHYTQHNLQVADGRAALKELVLHSPAGTAVHTVRIFADGDYVVAQTDYNCGGPKVGFDVFRFDRDKIVEHWGNLQDKCAAPNPSGRTQLDGPTKVTDVDKTDANKLLMKGYFDDVVLGGQRDKVGEYRSAANLTIMTLVPSSHASPATRAIARGSFNTISWTCNRSDLEGISDTSQAAGRPRFP